MKKLFASIFIVLLFLFGTINPSYSMVSSENPRVSYVGNAVIDDFAFTYKVFQTTDLLVYVDDVLQTLNVHYTVVLNTGGLGGTITFGASYIPGVAAVVDIVRSIPLTQNMNLYEGQRLPAETLESTLDKQTMTLQDLNSKLSLLLAGGGITPIDVNTILAMLGYEDVRKYASINAAITAIGSLERTLVVSNAQTLTANLTVPTNIKLVILKGGSIVKASTYTLTINGPFEAGLYQVFSGFDAGDVTFGAGAVKEVYPEWWGENTTPGTTDMVAAIQAAQSSLNPTSSTDGGRVILSKNVYAIASTWTMSTSNASPWYNITFKGSGQGTEIRWIGAANGRMLQTGILNSCHFEDIYFNGNNSADFCVYYGQIDGDVSGLCQKNTFKNCNFAYSKYGFGIGKDANTTATLFENCHFRNSSYAGFASGSLNTDIIQFKDCIFSSNAFGVGSFIGSGGSTTKTSLITGVDYTYNEVGYLKNMIFDGCVFLTNTEADIFYESLIGTLNFIGCGGEASRTHILDLHAFDGSSYSISQNEYGINIIGCYYNGFGTAADALNDFFIKVGVNLNITGTIFFPQLNAPRSQIITTVGHLHLQNVGFSVADDISAWPTIFTYANSPYVRDAYAESISIRRADIATYQNWLLPIYTLTINSATPSVMPRVPVYKTANTLGTTITTFTDGTSGQEILIIFTDANTTIAETDNIKLSAAFTSSADDIMKLIYDGTNWYEISRSVN